MGFVFTCTRPGVAPRRLQLPSFAAVSATLTAMEGSPETAGRPRTLAAATFGGLRAAVQAVETGSQCHRFLGVLVAEWTVCCGLGDGGAGLSLGGGPGGCSNGGDSGGDAEGGHAQCSAGL